MKINDLIPAWVNRDKSEEHERKVGRYHASEIYSIIKGYIIAKNFFSQKDITGIGPNLITDGIAAEDVLTKIFKDMKVDCEFQAKKEIQIDEEIVLVAKADFLFKEFTLETKCPDPDKVPDFIPDKWVYQLEAYYRAFERPVYLGIITHPFTVKQIKYVPSDERWQEIKDALIDFHRKVKKVDDKRLNK